eukprot:942001-Pleurochrysis_carterae.AAC.1
MHACHPCQCRQMLSPPWPLTSPWRCVLPHSEVYQWHATRNSDSNVQTTMQKHAAGRHGFAAASI